MHSYVHSPSSAPVAITTHLCPSCCRRVTEHAKNPRHVVAPAKDVPTPRQIRREQERVMRVLTLGEHNVS